MKKKFVSLIIVVGVLLSLMLLQQTAMADYTLTAPTSGSGTAEDPYRIANAENLAWFAGLVNGTLTDRTAQNRSANAVLTANIDLNPGYTFNSGGTYTEGSGTLNSWTPIGYRGSYEGTFDGANYTISGLYIGSYSSYYCGLFEFSSGTIKNIKLDNSYISSTSDYVGGVCGQNEGTGTITNCSNSGTVTGTSDYVGGVCGANYGTITNCSNSGTVTGSSWVGGVCGRSYSGSTITNCSNTGTVKGSSYVGGVCGYNVEGTITNCYYLSGTALYGVGAGETKGQTTVKTATQYESGEVCYLLNGDNQTSPAFGQLLSGTNADAYPVLYDGTNDVSRYTDDSGNTAYKNHSYTTNGICTVCGGYAAPSMDADGVYQIENAGNLYWFAQLVNGKLTDGTAQNTSANAVLTADIDLNPGYTFSSSGYTNSDAIDAPLSWTPIGTRSSKYKGTFDGANHTISGLYIGSYSSTHCGLFGYSSGTIKNIKLDNLYIYSTNYYVGGVCGYNYGTITSCSNSGTVTGSYYVGGVCGFNYEGGTITNCSNSGTVTGSYYVGGVCGRNDGTITNCSNIGTVSGSSGFVGGVCGFNGSGTIENCSNTGAVTGSDYVGGVCGRNNGTITKCSNTGTVTGSCWVGGVCGYSYYSGTITNCSNTGAVSGTDYCVGGVCGYNNGIITNCSNIGTVSGSDRVGGVCGYNNGTITKCSNTGTVTGSSDKVGGVCGGANGGTITNCYNTGAVSGSYCVGGVCGYNDSGTITNCSNTGAVSGTGNNVGGVCGYNNGIITNCSNIGTVSGTNRVGGVCGYNDEGTITNCYYLSGTASYGVGDTTSDTAGQTTVKTAEEYASGEVCYLLNADTIAWYQNISTTEKDKYPVLDSTHKQVYSNAGTYSNIEVTTQTSSQSEDANKGDYAYGYVTNINTNDCTVNSLIWNVSAAKKDGNEEEGTEAKGTVTYGGDTSGLSGNIKVGLILTKTSDSVYTIESVSAYVE